MKTAIQSLKDKIARTGGAAPRRASYEDLERAKAAGFPPDLIEFYRECEPDDCIEFKQRIWSITDALVENTDAAPGLTLCPHGFVVFASNLSGDAYCIDTNAINPQGYHEVVLFPHDAFGGEEASISEIEPYRLKVASSLADFLAKFTDETLMDEPLHPNP